MSDHFFDLVLFYLGFPGFILTYPLGSDINDYPIIKFILMCVNFILNVPTSLPFYITIWLDFKSLYFQSKQKEEKKEEPVTEEEMKRRHFYSLFPDLNDFGFSGNIVYDWRPKLGISVEEFNEYWFDKNRIDLYIMQLTALQGFAPTNIISYYTWMQYFAKKKIRILSKGFLVDRLTSETQHIYWADYIILGLVDADQKTFEVFKKYERLFDYLMMANSEEDVPVLVLCRLLAEFGIRLSYKDEAKTFCRFLVKTIPPEYILGPECANKPRSPDEAVREYIEIATTLDDSPKAKEAAFNYITTMNKEKRYRYNNSRLIYMATILGGLITKMYTVQEFLQYVHPFDLYDHYITTVRKRGS